MDATTLVAIVVVVLVVAAAVAAFVLRRRRRTPAAPAFSAASGDRTYVGIGQAPRAADATEAGTRPAPSDATVVDVRAAPAPPPPAAPADAPTVVVGAPQPEPATLPTVRLPKLRARVTVTKGGSGAHELEAREYTIGRSVHADIVLADPSVSGHHAKLSPRGDAFALSDLGSTNGTTVDGRAVKGEHALRGGETIGVGDARLRYERLG